MQNFRPFPSCILWQMPGNLSGRTDRRTDGRTCRKTVTVGRMDQRTHVQVKRGYFMLRTDRHTDGQRENIMPPAPKGGGIKTFKLICRGGITANKGTSSSNEEHASFLQMDKLTITTWILLIKHD